VLGNISIIVINIYRYREIYGYQVIGPRSVLLVSLAGSLITGCHAGMSNTYNTGHPKVNHYMPLCSIIVWICTSTLLLQISMNVSWTMVDVIRTAPTFLDPIHAPVLEASCWMRAGRCAMYIF